MTRLERVEDGPDGSWVVRPVTGAAATKDCRCPGCDHEVRAGAPHLVVWPDGSVEERRHWHPVCWRSRDRRRLPGRRRPAPIRGGGR